MITRAHVQPYIGQPIVVHTHEGTVHRGVLHSVNNNGIYIRPMRGRTGLAGGTASELTPEVLGDLDADSDVTEAWLPFFFIPWLAMAAFYPWGWWW